MQCYLIDKTIINFLEILILILGHGIRAENLSPAKGGEKNQIFSKAFRALLKCVEK
jgi:hypothetical protein